MTQVIACAVQLGGMPVPVGGGIRLVDALAGIVRDAGGELRTGTEVARITVSGGRATGVALADGDTVSATRAVIAGVTPTHLYGSLLRPSDIPADVRDAAARYRYGRAGMQIHLALDEPPRWKGPDAERLGRDRDRPRDAGARRRLARRERGRARPASRRGDDRRRTAVRRRSDPRAGRQVDHLDPAPGAPGGPVEGDAAGELDVGDGTWTEELREAYADRIVARLGESIENLGAATLARKVLSPVDLEALNCNLVDGDIYAGSCALDQNLLWRPFASAPGHRTTVEGLWHVGASTHPGPGLGAGSGYLVAKELTKPPLTRRLACKASRTLVKLSLSTISTLNASFAEDVAAYAAAGFDAIGLWEFKLPDDDAANSRCSAQPGSPCRTASPPCRRSCSSRSRGWRARPTPRSGSMRSARRSGASPPTSRSASSAERPARRPLARQTGARDRRRRAPAGAAARSEAGVRLGFEPIHPAQRDTAGFVDVARGRARAARRGRRRRRRDHGRHLQPRPRDGRGARRVARPRHGPPRRRRAARAVCPASGPCPRADGRSAEIVTALRGAAGTARSTSRSSRHRTPSGRSRGRGRAPAMRPLAALVAARVSPRVDCSLRPPWIVSVPLARGARPALGLRRSGARGERRLAALLPRAPERAATGLPGASLFAASRARSGLLRRFDEAATTLDDAEPALRPDDVRRAGPAVHLERGRLANTVGAAGRGRESFLAAWELAGAADEDALAVDAAHMLGSSSQPDIGSAGTSARWNSPGSSHDPSARRWVGVARDTTWAGRGTTPATSTARSTLLRARARTPARGGRVDRGTVARWSIARASLAGTARRAPDGAGGARRDSTQWGRQTATSGGVPESSRARARRGPRSVSLAEARAARRRALRPSRRAGGSPTTYCFVSSKRPRSRTARAPW